MKENRSLYAICMAMVVFGAIAGTVLDAGAGALPQIYDTTWKTFAVDENGTTPGGGGQLFDAEYLAYKLDGKVLSIGVQTGFDLSDGHHEYLGKDYYAGDLALSFDGAVTLGDATTYEYAVDFGFLTKDYDNQDVGGNSGTAGVDTAGVYKMSVWNNDIYYSAASSPFAMESGAQVSGLQENDYVVGNEEDSFFRFVSFDITTLGLSLADGLTVDAHWTMSCGNDTVNGNFDVAPVPEPATMLLFGTGLAGLVGTLRRKKEL